MVLNHTVNTYDSEPSWDQCTLFQEKFRAYAVSWMPSQNLLNQGNDTLYIEGSYLRPVEIKDLLINETGGMTSCVTHCYWSFLGKVLVVRHSKQIG